MVSSDHKSPDTKFNSTTEGSKTNDFFRSLLVSQVFSAETDIPDVALLRKSEEKADAERYSRRNASSTFARSARSFVIPIAAYIPISSMVNDRQIGQVRTYQR